VTNGETLVRNAEQKGVLLGFENREAFDELPLDADHPDLIAAMAKPNACGYWHDTGHAQVYENMGLLRHEEYLERFRDRLLGVHLHDVKGVINDHNAPFTGDFDFAILKPFLNNFTIDSGSGKSIG